MLGLKLNHVSKRGHWCRRCFFIIAEKYPQSKIRWDTIVKGNDVCDRCKVSVPYITYLMSIAYDFVPPHYNDVIMSAMASQTTSLTIVYSNIYLGEDQRKHQSSASLAFVRGIHRWPVNSPHKWPVTQKMFPFDDVIMVEELSGYHEMRICQTWMV